MDSTEATSTARAGVDAAEESSPRLSTIALPLDETAPIESARVDAPALFSAKPMRGDVKTSKPPKPRVSFSDVLLGKKNVKSSPSALARQDTEAHAASEHAGNNMNADGLTAVSPSAQPTYPSANPAPKKAVNSSIPFPNLSNRLLAKKSNTFTPNKQPSKPAARAMPSVIDKGTLWVALVILLTCAICTGLVYRFAAASQARDSASLLQSTARVKAVSVRSTFLQLQETAFSLGANLERSSSASAFEALAQGAMSRQKGLLAVGWVPAVAKGEPLALTRLQVSPSANFSEAKVDALMGTDVFANPAWSDALRLTKAVNTAQISYASLGIGDATIFQTVKSRAGEGALKGYVVLAVAMPALLDESLRSAESPVPLNAITLEVLDASEAAEPRVLFSLAPLGVASPAGSGPPSQVSHAQNAPFSVLSRVWQVQVSPNAEFAAQRESGLLPLVLLFGAGVAALLIASLLGIRHYTARLTAAANQKAIEARQAASATQTAELAVLQEAYKSVGEAELQKMQSEKMTTLATMMGGVAYEIHAPLNAVSTNIQTLLDINEQLATAVDVQTRLMQQAPNWKNLTPTEQQTWLKAAVESNQALDEIKLREMFADADNVTVEILQGLQRINDVSKSLKDFSRVDRTLVNAVDLHACIDRTLVIAQNVTRNKAEIVKRYGALPLIQCNPAQINQVILGIVSHAAQSMERFGQIVISTYPHTDGALVEIADNGKGMSDAKRAKIFEPFFTMKNDADDDSVGLAVCNSMVRAHGGSLVVQSTEGLGTVFTIHLPLRARAQPG